MTADRPWPGEPGVPLHPERDGWHWMLVTHGIGHAFPMLWDAGGRMWDAGDAGWTLAEDIATRWRYLGPCLTPADLAAERAAAAEAMREACAKTLMDETSRLDALAEQRIKEESAEQSPPDARERTANAFICAAKTRDCVSIIRALPIPAPDALARVREDARREGMAEVNRDALRWALALQTIQQGAATALEKCPDNEFFAALHRVAASALQSDAEPVNEAAIRARAGGEDR